MTKKTKNETVLDSNASITHTTAKELIELHKINLNEWKITSQLINKWDVLKKDENGNALPQSMFQTKVVLEKDTTKADYEQIRKEFIEYLKKISPHIKKKQTKPVVGGNLLEVNIFDFHFGKMSWHGETGVNYDTKIAKELFNQAIEDIIESSKGYKIDRILFPIGNDFFNSDSSHPYNQTTNGTPQEEDLRWQRTFKEGRELLVENILKLTDIAPVDVIIVPGNHDYERSFYLGDSLQGWFHNNKNVNVNNDASPRKYYQHGKVLIGFSHGNNERITDIPVIMPQECGDMWSSAKFKEFHVGHLHHKKEIKYQSVGETHGIIIRYMSSLSAADSWHHKKGYIGSKRSAEAFIWNDESGLKAQLYYNL
jgi:hypothetical protein